MLRTAIRPPVALDACWENHKMPREVTDQDGVTWSCIQAFAGLGNDSEKAEAARVDGTADHVHVVCTPSGGAKSVRLELPQDWEENTPDDALLTAISAKLAEELPPGQSRPDTSTT
jgi:allantoicase